MGDARATTGRGERVDGTGYRDWWRRQYGTPEALLDPFDFWRRGRSNIWIANRGTDPGPLTPVDGVGLPFLRTGRQVWKPTSVAAVAFGLEATRNVVELDDEETARFLDRAVIRFGRRDPRAVLPHRGFVIARYCGVPIGCGLWRRGSLESAVPKGKRLGDPDLPVRR